jgi:hypothetical protein
MESLEGYIYHYKCQRWYGKVNGFTSILTRKGLSEENIQEMIHKDALMKSGSETCDNELIQKYEILIKPLKTYPSITSVAMNLNLG